MTVAANRQIAPTRFQTAVLRYRATCNILNAGGRGSGKSFSLLLDCLSHTTELAEAARPLVMRESWAGMQQLMSEMHELCNLAYGSVQRNKSEGTLTCPNGAVITFTNIGDEDSYAKRQGATFSALYPDELGNYPPQAISFVNRMRSNLRVPPGLRPHIHATANPHGRGHSILLREYISKAPPWHPFDDPSGERWLWTTSDLEDNPHIDRESYRRQLIAACGADEALAKAWLKGDWSVLGGAMFAPPFDPAIHIIRNPTYGAFKFRMGGDWGAAAPATAILLGQLRDPLGPIKAGSIVALDEIDTADPNDLSLGNGAPPQALAEMIKEMLARNNCPRTPVCMDDARGLQSETVIGLFRENGITAYKPHKKDRVGTWTLVRSLLSNAVTGDGPGLYISPKCPHLIETIQEAPRGTLRAEDIDPKWQKDHWLDALGYGVRDLWGTKAVGSGRTIGMY